MGCWSIHCGISKIAITETQECVLLPLKLYWNDYKPATLPIFGKYNGYGGLEDIVEDDNIKLIESHFDCSIHELCEEIIKEDEEFKGMKFMWIDKKMYDMMSCTQHHAHKDYFNWDLKLAQRELSDVMGERSGFLMYEQNEMEREYILKEDGIKVKQEPLTLNIKYAIDFDTYGSRLAGLKSVYKNLWVMSSVFAPFEIHRTIQGGAYKDHQRLLEKFTEINKSYIEN